MSGPRHSKAAITPKEALGPSLSFDIGVHHPSMEPQMPDAHRAAKGLAMIGASAISSLTGCTACKSSIIQAPTPEEQIFSRKLSELQPATKFAGDCKDLTLDEALGKEVRDRICKKPDLYLNDSFRSSEQFCRNIVHWGQGSYKSNLGLGIFSGITGLAGATVGVTSIAKSDTKNHLRENVSLIAGGAVLTAVGFIFLGRAGAAATASGEAGLAFIPGLSDDERWKTCLAARAKWLGANAEATRVAFPKAPTTSSSESDEE